jgi:hypothetical protein
MVCPKYMSAESESEKNLCGSESEVFGSTTQATSKWRFQKQRCGAASFLSSAPAPGENFDAAPAPAAPAPTLLYSKAKFLKRTKVYTHVETILFI